MHSSTFHGLPEELFLEVISIAAWDASEVDKPWLCLIATISRSVWSTVRPILYHTVILTIPILERNINFENNPGFALTRRLWANSLQAWRASARIAAAFGGVEHFEGWDALFFQLCNEPDARFRPTHASLSCDLFGTPSLARYSTTLSALTHLHLVWNGEYRLPVHLLLLPKEGRLSALRCLVLEAATHEKRPAGLVDALLPFFRPLRTLKRIVVRVSMEKSQADDTIRALHEYARTTGEMRLWVCAAPVQLAPIHSPGICARWKSGRRLVSDEGDLLL